VAEKTHQADELLAIPKDLQKRLYHYASELGKEYLFAVTRQQALERLMRTFLPREGNGE
jgi:indole-3-glycerol phosphate synthase